MNYPLATVLALLAMFLAGSTAGFSLAVLYQDRVYRSLWDADDEENIAS